MIGVSGVYFEVLSTLRVMQINRLGDLGLGQCGVEVYK